MPRGADEVGVGVGGCELVGPGKEKVEPALEEGDTLGEVAVRLRGSAGGDGGGEVGGATFVLI